MKRPLKLIVAILLGLLLIRLCLPYFILRYATYRMNQIPEYRASIADISLNLIAGEYTIHGIELKKVNKNIPEPFFKANSIDLALDWSALLHGGIVAKIVAWQPEMNFVVDPSGQNEQLSIDQEWQQVVQSLFPLNINSVRIEEGKLHFRSFNAKPPFDLYLKEIQASVQNMQKVTDSDQANASSFQVQAKTMDGGSVTSKGNFNPFAKQPEFYLTFALRNMEMKAANNFLRHYVNVDLESGLFNLFVELKAAHGQITGYAKPIMKDLKVSRPKESDGPLQVLYKGALTLIKTILENDKKDTVATKIPIEGKIDDPEVGILATIGNALSHAFIQALLPQLDYDVKAKKVLKP